MGKIRIVLLFDEENEKQRQAGEFLKTQKRCKTALITELIHAWIYNKEGKALFPDKSMSGIDIQKVTLIAQKHKMQYSDVSILFYEAKASLDKDTANKKEAALNAKKDEERSEYNELNKYSGLNGRDKRIAILSAERADALERAKTLRAGAQAIMSASQQKEHDWAIHGGIASGIAGPAAGLAAAADIQAKNAQIRAQNAIYIVNGVIIRKNNTSY